MPTYKDIWYADGFAPLNPSAISAAEATSTGNKLESIAVRLPIKVNNETERNELYPEPKAGDAVYRLDLGKEERYYETYSVKDNKGGKPYDGWYLINSGQNIVGPDASYTYNLNGSAVGLTIANVLTSDFNFWRITYNLHAVTALTTASTNFMRFRFAVGASADTTGNYVCTQIGNNTTTPVARTNTGTSIPLEYEPLGSSYIKSGSILISGIASGDYPKIICQNYSSTTTAITETCGYFNSTTSGFNGFRIFSGSTALRGSISVRGYN